MKAVMLIVLAMSLYGLEHTLIERYFPKVPTLTVLLYMNMPLFILLCILFFFGHPIGIHIERPPSQVEVWMLLTSVVFIGADFCLYRSYHNGISAATATTAALMVPVFASVFKGVMHWGMPPNRYTFLAWLFGAITLVFMALSQNYEDKISPPH